MLLRLIVILASMLVIQASAGKPCGDFDFAKQHPHAYRLLENLYAVHATNSPPAEGILKSGSGKGEAFGQGYFRPTIHSALGGLAASHGPYNWDMCNYAVTIPMIELVAKTANINVYDTFTVGDFKLTNSSYVFVREGVNMENFGDAIVVRFPHDQKLSEVIRNFLIGRGAKVIDSEPGKTNGSAFLNGVDINHVEYFKPLLAALPYLSFGTHSSSEVGNAKFFGFLDHVADVLDKMVTGTWGGFASAKNIKFAIDVMEFTFNYLLHDFASKGGNDIAPQFAKAVSQYRKRWLNFYTAVQNFQQKKGSMPDIPMAQYSRIAKQASELATYDEVEKMIFSFPNSRKSIGGGNDLLRAGFENLPLEFKNEFLRSNGPVPW